MTTPETKTCPRCGNRFDCLVEHVEQCHCTQISVPPGMIERLRESYTDCLCPQCLQTLTAEGVGD